MVFTPELGRVAVTVSPFVVGSLIESSAKLTFLLRGKVPIREVIDTVPVNKKTRSNHFGLVMKSELEIEYLGQY
jgi:hypothetical protein